LEQQVMESHPRLIVLGGSLALESYPVREGRTIADKVQAKVSYDAAHLSLIIGEGEFQQPLQEGAHVAML
jgi:glycine hydroxymethyltransferase